VVEADTVRRSSVKGGDYTMHMRTVFVKSPSGPGSRPAESGVLT
jgi:hypothetical protein